MLRSSRPSLSVVSLVLYHLSIMEYLSFRHRLMCKDWGVLSSGSDMVNKCPHEQRIKYLQRVPNRLVILA